MSRQCFRFRAHHRHAESLAREFGQVEKFWKLFVTLAVSRAVVFGFAKALPADDRRELLCWSTDERPFRQEDRWQCRQPRPGFGRDWAIACADSLAHAEAPLATCDAVRDSLVAIGDTDLREPRVHVNERATFRAIVFL